MSDAEYPPEYADFFGIDLTAPVTGRARPIAVSFEEMGREIGRALGGSGSKIEPYANAYEFATRHELKIEKQRFALDDDYKHLRPIYEDNWPVLTLMAGAQTGKTAFQFVYLTWVAFGPAFGKLIGYYFPDAELPRKYSNERFKPFIRSNPQLAATLGADVGGEKGKNAVFSMNLDQTFLYFLTIKGKTATEGVPLSAVFFDEVRRMEVGDIERAELRLSAQKNPINVKASTARYPKTDIHRYFLQGDQRYFHTDCGCAENVVLSLNFPDCIADMRQATPQLRRKVEHAFRGRPLYGMTDRERAEYPHAVFICPHCGEILTDVRAGYWLPHEDSHFPHSYQMPQLLSPSFSAGRVLHAYEGGEDYQEFVNSCLGLAYVDQDKMPVQPEHIDACVDPELLWAAEMTHNERRRKLVNCGMGVDVQGGYGVAVIKKRNPLNGKHRTVHLEIVEAPKNLDEERTWWYRLGQLMYEFDVGCALIDEAPEFSESLAFAHAFRGRVFLANLNLGENAQRTVQWEEENLNNDNKQKADDVDQRFRVSMKRTHAIHWGVTSWKRRRREIPPLGRLVQTLPQQGGQMVFSAHLRVGQRAPISLGFLLREHLSCFVFRNKAEDTEEGIREGKKKWVAEHVGVTHNDFAISDLFASVAVERIGAPSGIRDLG